MTDDPRHTRSITVTRPWFEQLECYLHCDERATKGTRFDTLVLYTPFGKKLIFTFEEKK